MASWWLSLKGNSCVREGGKVSLSSRFARDPLIGISIRESKSRATFSSFLSTRTVRPEKRKKKKREGTKRVRRRRQDKKRGWKGERIGGGRTTNAEWSEERRKPRKKDGGKERRLPWRLIVSENPSSRSFCFRFYFLPSNPPVHYLPFVHTVPQASPIPASRDFYLVTFQAFLSPIWFFPSFLVFAVVPFSRCSAFSLLTLISHAQTRIIDFARWSASTKGRASHNNAG